MTIGEGIIAIYDAVEPFIIAGIPILFLVAGLRFGVRFIKNATR